LANRRSANPRDWSAGWWPAGRTWF